MRSYGQSWETCYSVQIRLYLSATVRLHSRKNNVCTIVKNNSPTASFVQRNITSVPNCIPDRKNGKEGIIQVPSKEIIIPFEYDFCGWFLEYELAEVRKNGKSGFVNLQNEIIIPLEYDRVGLFGFKYGICLVEKDGKCGFIDKNNNFVIPLKYGSSSEEFFEGIACVEVIENNNSFYKYIFPNDKDAF